MTDINYTRLNRFMHNHTVLSKLSVFVCKLITYLIYVFYPLFLLYVYIKENDMFLMLTAVPLVSIIILSVVRFFINKPRPYEKLPIIPLYNKKTVGKSFPSRHTFAIFIIAFSVLNVSIPLGAVIIFSAIILAALRIVSGVHYISDVAAGFIFAAVAGAIGYIII